MFQAFIIVFKSTNRYHYLILSRSCWQLGATVLIYAIVNDRVSIVELLLAREDVEVNIQDMVKWDI
jgi:hypothetical protein